jgi:phosphoribosylanthranilate isomerase
MPYHVRVKICGVTSEDDARAAAALGADAVGLNFSAESPRRIDKATARAILRALPPFIDAVGVFVNQPLAKVFPYANQVGGIRVVQWHGQNRELCDAFPFQLISAWSVRDTSSILDVNRYLDVCRGSNRLPAAVLVDGHASGQHGGTGRVAPWGLLAEFRPGIPVILAGGLTPENVAEAIRVVRPYAVDVASGVESSPGVKDPEKMRRFIANAREAAAALRTTSTSP